MAKVLDHGSAKTVPDTEAFRLRRFIERLVQVNAAEIRDEPTDLIDIALDESRWSDGLDHTAGEEYRLVGAPASKG